MTRRWTSCGGCSTPSGPGAEAYLRGLKQRCGVERAQVRAARAQRAHICGAIRAFLRLEWHRQTTGVSWWTVKTGIVREAVRAYLAAPRYPLHR